MKSFNRERFLLYCVAWIIGVQFTLFILAGVACSYGFTVKLRKVVNSTDTVSMCPGVFELVHDSAGESLGVLLALLGGGTIAMGEYQRRHPPERPQAPPALDPRDPRNRQ